VVGGGRWVVGGGWWVMGGGRWVVGGGWWVVGGGWWVVGGGGDAAYCSVTPARSEHLSRQPVEQVKHSGSLTMAHRNHTSHVTRHTSHVTRHTSHVTRHTSHVTRHVHVVGVNRQALLVQQRVPAIHFAQITTGLPFKKWGRGGVVAPNRNASGCEV
jgi:hypothetical protein